MSIPSLSMYSCVLTALSQPVTTNGVNWCDIGGLNLTSSGDKAKRAFELGPVNLAQLTARTLGFAA
jgi:hypothetical protein